ncbi:ankyrin repeat domain-containing protein 13C-A-like [Phoenix dactylifera]|uniref:Ankyrin repeat domain-containing protein 13C-A-like n=1 Tax=Phoenix dactylifera TaxID=42345 RepID=A0A8B7C123_PHODC|nr:ankyrin repeat domain-containing protein 13C-A-like [Phoenix dactylifera]
MDGIDASMYSHSPAHEAVLARDYDALKSIISFLPRLAEPSEIGTEADSFAEEAKADAISAALDRRDVPNRETPLHLAVRLGDASAAELLMAAGADWSLHNEKGWSALHEAICAGEEQIARIIVRHRQPQAWAKWCRRLPRLIATMRRMRDFYMEITFHFESSVIPFVSRIAPSDTYKIWKRGSNLRADMTLSGFDGFKIQRADQSVLFLGEGSEDGNVSSGSLCIVSHKDKEVVNALDAAGAPASNAEVQQEISAMSETNICRPGIDVARAVLLPQLTWRRQERSEAVGSWKAKVYEMHHVVVSVKSRRVPRVAAANDEEAVVSSSNDNETENDEYEDILNAEERKQLEIALKMESPDAIDEDISDDFVGHRQSCYEPREIPVEDASSCGNGGRKQDKKRWLGNRGKKGDQNNHNQDLQQKMAPPRSSLCIDEKVSDLLGDSPSRARSSQGRHSIEIACRREVLKEARDRDSKKSSANSANGGRRKEGNRESEFKRGLTPVFWLSPNFPLRTEELLPLLDILSNKVKAVRRLRELLTTKLPSGTFPVKVAIPVVPTIRVLVTFTKFEDLQPLEDFSTPSSSPEKKYPSKNLPSSSWLQWMKGSSRQKPSKSSGPSNRVENIQDPFMIPPDYAWVSPETKKKKLQENGSKSKKRPEQKRQGPKSVREEW